MSRIPSRIAAATLALSLGAFAAPFAAPFAGAAEVTDFSNAGSSGIQGTPAYEATTYALAGSTPRNTSNAGSSAIGSGSPLVARQVTLSQNGTGASPTDFSGAGSSAVGGYGTQARGFHRTLLAAR